MHVLNQGALCGPKVDTRQHSACTAVRHLAAGDSCADAAFRDCCTPVLSSYMLVSRSTAMSLSYFCRPSLAVMLAVYWVFSCCENIDSASSAASCMQNCCENVDTASSAAFCMQNYCENMDKASSAASCFLPMLIQRSDSVPISSHARPSADLRVSWG